MVSDIERKDLTDQLKDYGTWSVSSLGEAVFLVIWLMVQCGVGWAVKQFPPYDSADKFTLLAFRILFSITTLGPIARTSCTHMIVIIGGIADILVSIVKQCKRVLYEMGLSKGRDSNG